MLINPPTGLYRRDDRCQSKVDDQTVRVIFSPIDLLTMGAIARRLGAAVKVGDYPAMGRGVDGFEADVREFRPDILFLNTTVHTVADDMDILRRARELCPGVITLSHGSGVAYQAEKLLEKYHQCSAVFLGEPEETFAEIVRDVPNETPLWTVSGLVTRDGSGATMRTGVRSLIDMLDSLPLPARDLIDNELYRSPENGRKMTVIYAQRGCPGRCIFCPAGSMFGYTVRERSVKHIIAELKECVEKYGIRDFLFHGDTFTLHKSWLLNLCDEIVKAGLDIRWGCNSRVDTIDDERAAALKKAGCWVVAFGFEHGNQDLLENMRKGQRAERAFEAVAICKRAGLMTHGFFLIGLPWETLVTLKQLYVYARKLNTDFFDFNIACPLPGTQLYKFCLDEKLFERMDISSYAHSGVRTFTLQPEQLTRWRRKTLLKMYLRPRYVAHIIAYSIKTGTLKFYLRAAWNRLLNLLSVSSK